MRTKMLFAAAALALPLAACEPETETVSSRSPDPLATEIANAPPVELPPPVKASVSMRCQPGNDLVFVDFFQGDTQANFRDEEGDTPIRLRADAAGEPLTGEGVTVAGNEREATVTKADGTELTCTA